MAATLRIERWASRHERAALEYLDHKPYENVFLSYLIRSDPFALAHGAMHLAFADAEVRGAGYFGRQVVIAAEDDAIPALAHIGRMHRDERMLVGPRGQIARYWELVAPHHRPPRAVRERQFVMATNPQTLRETESLGVRVRHARPDEWRVVADNSAEMIAGELGYDPREGTADFAGGVRQMLERNLWWVGERNGELCFFCNVGPWSNRTAQLQGIWTPPEFRGRGYAHAALAGICRELFGVVPTLSLYVNDFNTDAVRLYERAGFAYVSEFQTLLF